MKISDLLELLKIQFPNANISSTENNLGLGSFAEWDSLAHFNFLLLIEEHYNIRFSLQEITELKFLGDIANALITKGIEQ